MRAADRPPSSSQDSPNCRTKAAPGCVRSCSRCSRFALSVPHAWLGRRSGAGNGPVNQLRSFAVLIGCQRAGTPGPAPGACASSASGWREGPPPPPGSSIVYATRSHLGSWAPSGKYPSCGSRLHRLRRAFAEARRHPSAPSSDAVHRPAAPVVRSRGRGSWSCCCSRHKALRPAPR